MTKNQKLYKSELSKIKARQRKLMSQGYILPEIPIPKQPKRVTKQAILHLKKFNLKYIRSLSEKEIDDEYLPGSEAFRREQKLKRELKKLSGNIPSLPNQVSTGKNYNNYKDAYDEDMEIEKILSTFEFELKSFGGNLSGMFLSWYQDLLNEYGRKNLAIALKNMPTSFYDFFEAYRPDYGKSIEMFEGQLKQYLPASDKVYENLKELDEETGYSSWEESDIDY